MKMIAVNSSSVAQIGYDILNKITTVRFHSGTLYNYFDVSLEEYNSIIEDDEKSVGLKLRKVMATKKYEKI